MAVHKNIGPVSLVGAAVIAGKRLCNTSGACEPGQEELGIKLTKDFDVVNFNIHASKAYQTAYLIDSFSSTPNTDIDPVDQSLPRRARVSLPRPQIVPVE
jgi:hypothetical protein